MIRTHLFPCSLPKPDADALNQESGRLYTRALVEHYRVYRQTGHWLSPAALEKLVDFYDAQDGRERILHAHSVDAAEQGFPKACKTARACRKVGLEVRYPYKCKKYRTTLWKNTGVRREGDTLLLARARGLAPLRVALPSHLRDLPGEMFHEMRLVWDQAARHYVWHVVIEDGREPAAAPGVNVAAVDLGEIHPAAVSDGQQSVIFSARALRSVRQNTARRLAALQRRQAAKVKGSRTWRRLQRRKNRFAAEQQRRTRDIEHKVGHAVVEWAVERKVGVLAIGDVRDIADGKRLNTTSQQKVSNWSHGKVRQYIEYKADAAGVRTELVDEHHSSQTCPQCGERHKPAGRVYRCPACGFVQARDAVGAVNLLSRQLHGEVGKVKPPPEVKYRHPFGKCSFQTGKRSRLDTAQVAWADQPG